MLSLVFAGTLAASTNEVVQPNATAPQSFGFFLPAKPPAATTAGAKSSPASNQKLLAGLATGTGSPPDGSFNSQPHHITPSVLKKYDADTNGIIDSVEWNRYRQDLETHRAEWLQSQAATNSPAASTGQHNPKKNPIKRKDHKPKPN